MRIPPRLLIVSLLVTLCLKTASGQQPGTVNVRQRIVTPAAGLPTVNVTVDRNRVPVNYEVTFTLSPAAVVKNPAYTITLQFGDDTQTQTHATQVVHPYGSPGNYRYSISLTLANNGRPTSLRIPRVSLSATPNAVSTNQTVTFSAQLSENYPNLKYRFVFADGSQTNWQDSPQTKHEYAAPKTYLAYVDIGEVTRGSVPRLGGSVRKAIEVTQPVTPPKVTVNFTAKPVRVEERQAVSFTARVASNNTNVSYRFVFGDKTPATKWQSSPQAKHSYLTAGNYSARVDVRVMNNRSGVQSVSSSLLLIEVKATARPVVSLTANPTSVVENLPVFFRAKIDSPNPNIRYRFDFGDGSSPTAWTGTAIETHAYSRAGNYAPYVEIGRATTGPINAIASSARQVTVTGFLPPGNATATPSPSPSADTSSPSPGTATPAPDRSSPSAGPNISNTGGTAASSDGSSPGQTHDDLPGPSNYWWIYLLIALALFAGYQAWKWLTVPRPTFHPRLDPGVSEVGVEKPLSIDFQLQLNPDIAAGEYGLETNESSFIRSERKSDD
jgi:PKD repeat protein